MHATLTYPTLPGGRFFTKEGVRGYRFGFNGQMKDDEVYGEGNSYTAEYWQYDPRLGRRWNVDPVDQVNNSNYATFLNNPLYYSDPSGATVDPGNIYAQQDGKYLYPDQILAFETFASTDKGREWILDRAEAGFELQGVFLTDLNIKAESSGKLHTSGIDVRFNVTSEIPDYAGGVTNNKVINGRLKLTFDLPGNNDVGQSMLPRFLVKNVIDIGHEVFYHGVPYERLFLSGNYKLNSNGSINYGKDNMRRYKNALLENPIWNDQNSHSIPLSQTPFNYSSSIAFVVQAQDIIYKNYEKVMYGPFNNSASLSHRLRVLSNIDTAKSQLLNPMDRSEIKSEIGNTIWNSEN